MDRVRDVRSGILSWEGRRLEGIGRVRARVRAAAAEPGRVASGKDKVSSFAALRVHIIRVRWWL